MNRTRLIALGIVLALVLGVVVSIVANGGSNDDDELLAARAETVVPNLCGLQAIVERRTWADAHRDFYDRIHQDAHILGSLVEKKDRAIAANFLRAKGDVERDMGSLSPRMAETVPALLDAARAATRKLGLVGADFPCS